MTVEEFILLVESFHPEPTKGCIFVEGPSPSTFRNRRYHFRSNKMGPHPRINGKQRPGSIIVLEYKLGRSILTGMLACHTCDNSRCVNKDHLYEGTPKENSRDMVERKRHWAHTKPWVVASGDRNGMNTHPEKNIFNTEEFKKKTRERNIARNKAFEWTPERRAKIAESNRKRGWHHDD